MLDDTHENSLYHEALKGVSQVGIAPTPFALWQSAAERQAKMAKNLMETNQAVSQVWQTFGQQSLVATQRTSTMWLEFFLTGLKQESGSSAK